MSLKVLLGLDSETPNGWFRFSFRMVAGLYEANPYPLSS